MILLKERLLLIGLNSPDQLWCTQASQGECVLGKGCHPADLSFFCIVRLCSNLVYFIRSSFVSRRGSRRLEPPVLVAMLTVSHRSQPAETNNQVVEVLGCVDVSRQKKKRKKEG